MTEVFHIVVKGRVQAVGFRYHTEQAAQRYGVAGWVRNLPGGEVEILARIPGGESSPFVQAIRKGPPMARVTQVDIQHAPEGMECPARGFSVSF